MALSSIYLIAFNLLSCVGWLLVLVQGVGFLSQGKAVFPSVSAFGAHEHAPFLSHFTPAFLKDLEGSAADQAASSGLGIFAAMLPLLLCVQSLALMEVVHAAIGLVRSPVVTTFMQVYSRILVAWGVFYTSKDLAMHQWAFALTAISWSLVEVPRYLFYAWTLVQGGSASKVPHALFWMRYSLFAVLYPTGITGELVSMYVCLKDDNANLPAIHMPNKHNAEFSLRFLLIITMASYVFGGPTMYNHMRTQRSSAFAKRKAELAESKKTA